MHGKSNLKTAKIRRPASEYFLLFVAVVLISIVIWSNNVINQQLTDARNDSTDTSIVTPGTVEHIGQLTEAQVQEELQLETDIENYEENINVPSRDLVDGIGSIYDENEF